MLRDGAVAAIASSSGDNWMTASGPTAINDRKGITVNYKATKSSVEVITEIRIRPEIDWILHIRRAGSDTSEIRKYRIGLRA